MATYDIHTHEEAESIKNEAEGYYSSGNTEKAKELFAKVLSFAAINFPSDHPKIAESKVNFAKTLHKSDEFNSSIDLLNEAITIYQKHAPRDNFALGDAYIILAHVLKHKGDYETALKYFNKSLNVFTSLLLSNDILVLYAELGVAFCHAELGNFDKAKNHFERLLELFNKNYPENYEDISAIYMGLFDVHRKLNHFELAFEMLYKMTLIESKIQDPDHNFIFGFFYELGCSLCKAKNFVFSKKVFLDGLDYINRCDLPKDKDFTIKMVLKTKLELSFAFVKLKEFDFARDVICEIFNPIVEEFGPCHPTTKRAEKVLRKSYGLFKYIKIRKILHKKLLSFLEASGSTKVFHIHWIAHRSKYAYKMIASFWIVVFLIATIYLYTKGYISYKTNFKTALMYFVLILFFFGNIFVLYRIFRRISNFIKVYGVSNINILKTMNSLRKRQNEEILSVDTESEIHVGKGANWLIKKILKCFYVLLIAVQYPDNMKFEEKTIYEIENFTNIRYSLYIKFWINIFFYTFLGILSIFLWILYDYYICLGLGISLILQVIYCIVFFFKPPTFLFLGTSKPDTFNLLSRIDTSTYRLGTASLLYSENHDIYRSYEIDFWNIYRTRDDVEWMDSVKNLIEIVPAIIIDGRSRTEAINQEMEYLFKSNYFEKLVIIIISKNRKYPILDNMWYKEYSNKHKNVQLLYESQLSYVLKCLVYEFQKNLSYNNILKFKENLPYMLDTIDLSIKNQLAIKE